MTENFDPKKGMRRYRDPQKHLEESMDRSAKRYVNGLRQAGLKPNDRLTRAMAERTAQEAREDYVREATQTRDHNINLIMRNHHKDMNNIKRQGMRLGLMIFPPIAVLFGLLAWYNFSYAHDFPMGIVYTIGSLAFIAMLVLGAIFDRPKDRGVTE